MNLNKQQQQSYTQLSNILKAIRSVVQDPAVIQDKMSAWVEDFEASVGLDVKVRYADEVASELRLVDCSRDSLKSTLDATPELTLRSRSEGIRISVSALYKDQYAYSNADMADALEALAKELRGLPFQIIDKGTCDIHAEMGVHHANEEDKPADLEPVIDPELPSDLKGDADDAQESPVYPDAGVIDLVQIPGEAEPV